MIIQINTEDSDGYHSVILHNDESYYRSQGCKPQTVANTHHVLTWNCPPGTETIQERLFTANKTVDEICYDPKYNKTKAYTEMCT